MSYIGVDLHTTQINLKTADDYRFKQYRLDQMEDFLASLTHADEFRGDGQYQMAG